MLEAFFQGFGLLLFNTESVAALFLGILLGLAVGILPGLGGPTTMAILVPFTWGMSPVVALGFLTALNAVTMTSGSLTAILLNIPGENASVPTLFDGFPMNRKGEGARAIGAAVVASMAGGVIAVGMAFFTIPFFLPIIKTLKTPEILFLVILGIAFIATLTGHAPIKGFISGLLGLLLSLIGLHVLTGVPRFTFNSLYLYEGISIPIFITGLFGLSEMMDMMLSGEKSIASFDGITTKIRFRDTLKGAKDVLTHKWLSLRCTLLGYIVGLIPGAGAGVAIYVAYGHAKQSSKNPEEFGHGNVAGVIAPEAANNAIIAGSWLTTLTLGIPGSTSGAILLAALFATGISIGPSAVNENLPLIFALQIGIVFANIVGGLICLCLASSMVKLAFLDIRLMFAEILTILFVAAFVTKSHIEDLLVTILTGLLGVFMKRFGYSRAAMSLGFVLGDLFEYNFYFSLKLYGPQFFLRLPSLIIIAITIIALGYRPIMRNMSQLTARWRKV